MRSIFVYPGWSFPVETLHPLLEEAGASLAPSPEAADLLIGWSLGGVRALMNPSNQPRILLASTARFCADGQAWPGMPIANVRALRRQLERSPDAAMTGFHSLCARAKTTSHELESRAKASLAIGIDRLISGLDELVNLDARQRLTELDTPILMLHGVMDQVIPIEAARATAALSPNVRLHEHPEAGHDLPLTHIEWVAKCIREFVCERPFSDEAK